MTSLIDLQEQARIMHACAGPAEQSVLVATESGYGFICKLSDLMVRNRSGKAFVTLAEHDVPLALIPLDGYAKQIACLSEQNRLLVFNLDEIKCQAGGRGVILIDLDQGDSLVQVRLFGEAGLNIQYQGRALKPIFSTLAQQDLEIYTSKRARKGKIIDKKWKSLLLMAS
jgi:topoisomerase-4 subunit A